MNSESVELPESARWETHASGLRVLAVDHPRAVARVAMHGAHILEWTPAGGRPVLYVSPRSEFMEGKPIRGGIPVCWPWFGAHPAGGDLPGHGFARLREWDLLEVGESPEGVRLCLGLQDCDATRAIWPHAYMLRLDVKIGEALEVRLTTSNTGEQDITISEALHSYLQTADIRQTRVEGLEGKEYIDTVGGGRVAGVQDGPVVFDREVDRIFGHAAGARLVDEAGDRVIEVSQEGSANLVVWNPWVEKSLRLADLPPEGFHEFLCIEAANCAGGEVRIEAGASHTIGTVISVG